MPSQSQRAIKERQRRSKEKETRRLKTFIHDYIQTKHGDIYEEAFIYYKKILGRYPTKNDLTKTYMYKKWKNEQFELKRKGISQQVSLGQSEPPHVKRPQVEPEQFESAQVGPPQVEQEQVQSPQVEVDFGEPPQVQRISSPPPPPQDNIIELASQGVISEDQLIGMNIETMDRIVNNIIINLERDQEIRELLNDIGQNMEQDEGIEINYDEELTTIVETF